MTFKENLKKKMEIDRLTKKVLATVGPLESGRKVDKQTMRRLLAMRGAEHRDERDLELYILDTSGGKDRILVLDNDLTIYQTGVEDVAMRKSPTVKEMLNIRNVIKILNDADVVVSKKEDSLRRIREESIESLDLSFTEADVEGIRKGAVAALQEMDSDGVLEGLALFGELLGYQPPPKVYQTTNVEMLGELKKKDTGELSYGPVVLYNLVNHRLMLIDQPIGSRDKEKVTFLQDVAVGQEKADLEGPPVFDYLKKAVTRRNVWTAA